MVQIVVGGAFGSEGKGHVAAWLARQEQRELLAMRVGGPNAGHTAIGMKGETWRLRQVPVAAVVRMDATLAIGPDSEIDPPVLAAEIEELDAAGYDVSSRLVIDQEATVITDEHKQQEAEMVDRLGSTGKGIGAARAARLMRTADRWGGSSDVGALATDHELRGGSVQLEGTQGFGLGLRAGYYPKCTSRDVRAADVFAMSGMSLLALSRLDVVVVFRTFPIRVAGDSGPLQGETTWEELGLEIERTTVTQKVRRVGAWDAQLAARAIAANLPCTIALMMADQTPEGRELAGLNGPMSCLSAKDRAVVVSLVNKLGLTLTRLIGTGPDTMIEVAR